MPRLDQRGYGGEWNWMVVDISAGEIINWARTGEAAD